MSKLTIFLGLALLVSYTSALCLDDAYICIQMCGGSCLSYKEGEFCCSEDPEFPVCERHEEQCALACNIDCVEHDTFDYYCCSDERYGFLSMTEQDCLDECNGNCMNEPDHNMWGCQGKSNHSHQIAQDESDDPELFDASIDDLTNDEPNGDYVRGFWRGVFGQGY